MKPASSTQKRATWKKIILVNLLVLVSLVAAAEIFFRANKNFKWFSQPKYLSIEQRKPLNEFPPIVSEVDLTPLKKIPFPYTLPPRGLRSMMLDRSEQFILKPHMDRHHAYQSKVTVQGTGEIVYDTIYRYDEVGRRAVEPKPKGQRPYFFVALGDSFTFGEGVSQNENYPAFLAKKTTAFHVYNAGWHGYSPNRILHQLDTNNSDFYLNIREKEGVLAYLHMREHMRRVTCPSTCLSQLGSYILDFPYYRLDSSGRPVKKGTFRERYIRNFFYRIFSASALVDFYKVQWPLRYTTEDFNLVTGIMKEIKARYDASIKVRIFYYIFYPGTETYVVDKLTPLLQSAGFKVLDYSLLNLPELTEDQEMIPGDSHPSAKAYWLLAELISRQLKADFEEAKKTKTQAWQ